ncbi:sodium:calcium antiporter [Erythrobacter insulae]|uniref:Sodium:calcium antiporter n=1 Tax=Erythrobacter insulae TaxID=2584124 RepID=A0A547PBW7_9SPHN|nr:sodium:calcium antiporter [Erythrobacter insulae]TRD11631.1 sodium:calcium antiporter [Erythrobacter insulae]
MSALWQLVLIFLAAAGAVWWAGTRLPRYVIALSERTGLGQGFAGMLVLGGITSLPELGTATSAAALGAPLLAFNNILGSASFNILLLAVADMVLGARPLTSVVAKPATLIQGVLGMMLLALVIAAILFGDRLLAGAVGIGSTVIFLSGLLAIRVADRSERRPMWMVVNPPDQGDSGDTKRQEISGRTMTIMLVMLSAVILSAGAVLAMTADDIAARTGMGKGLVGVLFVAAATSLPELSAITGAMRRHRYELAVGEIFGSNLFNLAIIFAIDLFAPGPPVIELAGTFEALAGILALAMTGVFVIGLIERRDRTVLRMGQDSLVAVTLYLVGLVALINLDV